MIEKKMRTQIRTQMRTQMRTAFYVIVGVVILAAIVVIACCRKPRPTQASMLVAPNPYESADRAVNLNQIHPNLYLGNVATAKAAQGNFDSVVCVAYGDTCNASTVEDTYVDATFPDMLDIDESDFIERVSKAAEFINQALEDGKRVLVHCHAGINRSVSSIVAYAALRAKAKASSTIAYVRRMNRDHRNLPAVSNPAFEQYLVRRWG